MSAEWTATLTLVGIYGIVAIATQLGMLCGAFSMATVGWMAIGAYGAAVATTHWGVNQYVGLGAALVVGAVVGPLITLPVQRISGLYFALVSLAFVLVLQAVFSHWSYTGGATGMYGVPLTTTLGRVGIAMVLVVAIASYLSSGRVGRALRASGQDTVVGGAVGVNVVRTQMVVGGVSAAMGVLGGFLYAGYVGYVDPSVFGFTTVVQITVMVIIGGRNNWFGALLGALLITALPLVLRPLADYRDIVSGCLLVIVAVAEPAGLLGVAGRLARMASRMLRRRWPSGAAVLARVGGEPPLKLADPEFTALERNPVASGRAG